MKRINATTGPSARLMVSALCLASLSGLAVPAGRLDALQPPPSGSTAEAALELDFEAFDQNFDGGWRSLESGGRYAEAAHLIDRYLAARGDLLEWQIVLLRFHAGQMYAYSEDYASAIERFEQARESDAVGPGWEPYVRATIAFLRRDRDLLLAAQADLEAAPEMGGPDPNRAVVQSLLDNFDLSYTEAYEAAGDRPNGAGT